MAATVLYQGHGSVRLTSPEVKVIYLDPYAGTGYDRPADLILVSHQHFDHNQLQLIENRAEGCTVITEKEALKGGVYHTFRFPFVTVEAVQACNEKHSVHCCVGYILTFRDGAQVYFSCDTSMTQQMPALAERALDYAFFCSDGWANMSMEEASQCADVVKARHSIPYHTAIGALYDRTAAETFHGPGRILLEPGQELVLRHGA